MSVISTFPRRIAIIGGGFTGTSLVVEISRFYTEPLEIYFFEKTATFCQGEAYRTPFPFHLLNVRAKEMSIFEEEPDHFSHWLISSSLARAYLDLREPIEEQFLPRFLYHHYLQSMLEKAQSQSRSTQIYLKPLEVMDIKQTSTKLVLLLSDQTRLQVDKAILALGNGYQRPFVFPTDTKIKCIDSAWNYRAPLDIPRTDSVLIVGTGLSMVDTVLTLSHQQHEGQICAISRHGLLPLPHLSQPSALLSWEHPFDGLRSLLKKVRQTGEDLVKTEQDWRSIFQALRNQFNHYWLQSATSHKKQFLRHVLPYWNVHRHRLPATVYQHLEVLKERQQLKILSARLLGVKSQTAFLRLRYQHQTTTLPVQWIINCTGPSLAQAEQRPPLLNALLKRGLVSLNELKLGVAASIQGQSINALGKYSSQLYVAGPLMKGIHWECTAVPDIRKNNKILVSTFMSD